MPLSRLCNSFYSIYLDHVDIGIMIRFNKTVKNCFLSRFGEKNYTG